MTVHCISKIKYRKILKISPGTYIFQRPFLRGLYLERLIFGGAYIRRGLSTEGKLGFKIDWASLIVQVNVPFLFCFLCIRGQLPSTSPWRTYIWRGDLTEDFFALPVWEGGVYLEGLIFGILRYFESFTSSTGN